MDLMLASAVFALVFVTIVVLLSLVWKRGSEASGRMHRMLPEDAVPQDVDIVRRHPSASSWPWRWLPEWNAIEALEQVVVQAGLKMSAGDLLLIMTVAFGAGVTGGWFLWHSGFYALLSGLGAGWVPLFYVRWRRQRRLLAFTKQLPYALDLIKSSLEAGHSLHRAMQVAVSEFADPLGGEFRTVLEETRIGLPLPRALESMLRRVPERDLRLLVVAVKVQAEVGSSLATIVGRLSELVRARQKLQMQVRAMTAQQRFGGVLVGVMPIVVLAVFSLIDPSYPRMLFTNPTGLKIVKLAAALDLTAIIIIRRMLRLSY
jgi:tight adherence protein B